ncbi:MAG: hypothetical protein K2J77_13125 [Oscillospiraceae bacterium]|nr:hypothetical protein [Oscillospiraceae bacterium]
MIKKKRVAALCKSKKRLLMQTLPDNTQWIGDGGAMYILAGIEPMSEDSLASMLDYSEKDITAICFRQVNGSEELFSDDKERDVQIEKPPKRVIIENAEYLIFETVNDLIFINGDYLKPIVTDDQTTYHMRTLSDGQNVLCVKKGFLPEAVILGVNFDNDALNGWFDDLAGITTSVQNKFMARRETVQEEPDMQMTLEEGAE